MAKTYKFACKDIGMSCGFKAEAKNENELMAKIAGHAKSAHGMTNIDSKTMAAVKAAIKEE